VRLYTLLRGAGFHWLYDAVGIAQRLRRQPGCCFCARDPAPKHTPPPPPAPPTHTHTPRQRTRAHTESDVDREKGRSFRRTVFYKKDWEQHRSIVRYFQNIDGILTSRIVRGLLPPLACVLVSSYMVCLYEELWQVRLPWWRCWFELGCSD